MRRRRVAESSRSEAAALVDSLSDDELARHLEAAAWLAGVELYLDRYAEGEAHANRALAVARATGQGELFLLLAATLGGLLRQRGKLAEAAELLDGGIEAARLLGNTHALVWTLLGRSAASLRTGDVALALATAQESFDLSRDADSNFHSAEAAADLAAALLEAGQPEPATAAVELYTGDPTRAAERALASAAAADEAGAPVEAALSRTLAGLALAQTGERDRAVTELKRAAGVFEECGALRYRDEAEHELRKLGYRIHRRARPGSADGTALESLTERERQLAQLVADRKTNPESRPSCS